MGYYRPDFFQGIASCGRLFYCFVFVQSLDHYAFYIFRGRFDMRMNMDEKSQILYMQTRLVRLASEQWHRLYCSRMSSLILEFKAKNWLW
jgi:hypothetical protein